MERLADELFEAERTGVAIDPLSERYPSLSPEDAYAIQASNAARRVQAGQRQRGHKVGLTSAAMQEMLGVKEPDFGTLFDAMFVEDHGAIDVSGLVAPRVESEIAFVMQDDLRGPGLSVSDVLCATAGVTSAIEVIDSRIRDWRITLTDTVADNGSSARVVLGGTLVPVETIDLRVVGGLFSLNGAIVATGAGAAVLGHPARCVAWLANKLAELGQYIAAGDVVMAGSIHKAFDVGPGDVATAEFDRLGAVTVRFTGAAA